MKNIIDYKGYFAKIEYNDEDDVLFGRIQGISDSISFEGTSIKEIKESFHEAVDDYLDMCSRYGKEPEKPYKGSFNVRISPELHKRIALRAVKLGISLNQFVENALKKCADGESDHIQNINDNLGEVANVISEKFYQLNSTKWASLTYNPFPSTTSKRPNKGADWQ